MSGCCWPPPSRLGVVVLPPTGNTRIGPIYNRYCDEYPEADLHSLVSREEFETMMHRYLRRLSGPDFRHHVLHGLTPDAIRINGYLSDNFPCFFCQLFAYGCALCTLGLSCIPACLCTNEGVGIVEALLRRANEETYSYRGVEWRFVRTLFTSWVEIQIKSDPDAETSSV